MYHPETNEQIARLTARITQLENAVNGLRERIMYLEQNSQSRLSVNSSSKLAKSSDTEDVLDLEYGLDQMDVDNQGNIF